MLKYYRKYDYENEETEITCEEALKLVLGSWRDCDRTRDMLTIQNRIDCHNAYAWVYVKDPDSELIPIPGLINIAPDGIEYDEITGMRMV